MNILVQLVSSRAVDLYHANGTRYTSHQLTTASRELCYIAIRRNLTPKESNALVSYLERHCHLNRPNERLERGKADIYRYREIPYSHGDMICLEDAYIIVKIYEEGRGLA